MGATVPPVDWEALVKASPPSALHDFRTDYCTLYDTYKPGIGAACARSTTFRLAPLQSTLCLVQLFVFVTLVLASAMRLSRRRAATFVLASGVAHYLYWSIGDAVMAANAPPAISGATASRSYIDTFEPLLGIMWEHAHGGRIYDTFVKADDGSTLAGPTSLPSCGARNATARKIPKLLHQFDTRGFGGLPAMRQGAVLQWRRLRGIRHLFWDERSLLAWLQSEYPSLHDVYTRLLQPVARADFARYAILFRFGGFYIDTDRRPTRTARSVLFELARQPSSHGVGMSVCTQENSRSWMPPFLHGVLRYNIDFISATPGHPLLLRVLANVYYQLLDTQPLGWALGAVARFFFRAGPEAASRLLSRHLQLLDCADFDHRVLNDANFTLTFARATGEAPVPFATSTMDTGGWVTLDALLLFNLACVALDKLLCGALVAVPTLTLLLWDCLIAALLVLPMLLARRLARLI
tara:strand:- start:66 stop:1463 length:1398 start_codon:yes stop_codon:yes gene_type:complete